MKPRIIIDIHRQSGKKPNYLSDIVRLAEPSGKRQSKTGKIYWETRKNRSDLSQKKRI